MILYICEGSPTRKKKSYMKFARYRQRKKIYKKKIIYQVCKGSTLEK